MMNSAESSNIVEDLYINLQEKNSIHMLEDELKKLDRGSFNDAELESWHHLYGICSFLKNDHEEAKARFARGLDECPNSHEIAFSLGQEHVFLKEPEKAFPLFNKCKFPNVQCDYVLAMSRYAYLYSEYETGINIIKPFFDCFLEVKILDDHFLYMRGLPFFSVAWSHLTTHCILSNNNNLLIDITKTISSNCTDYDFLMLEKQLSCFLSKDFKEILPYLDKHKRELQEYGESSGYIDMMIACYKSLTASSLDDCLNIFDEVVLADGDFAWLEDIRTLAIAQSIQKFGQSDEEKEFLDIFFQSQPMLFEPDHALNFALLDYQETIKHNVRFF